jgi:putative nucleotidyltransferase with HDIG domain
LINRDEISPDELIPVDILAFRNTARDISFDVFLKLSPTNVARVFSKTTGIDYRRLAQYIQKEVKELFIHPSDELACKQFIAKTAESIFKDPNTSQEKKIATLLNMTDQNMSEIFSQFNISEDSAATAQQLIRNYVDLMVHTPQTLTAILKLASHGEYLYYHSIAVSIFSMFIAKASGQFNQRMLEILGLGGFLHDIGYTQIPKEVIYSPAELTPDQWREMHSHPKSGLKMIEATRIIPDEVRHIVYQHHEEPSGNGYPNGIHGSVIYYPAKIVAIADSFSALISKRPFRAAYSAKQAVKIIQNLTGKYDRELVNVLASVFINNPAIKQNK